MAAFSDVEQELPRHAHRSGTAQPAEPEMNVMLPETVAGWLELDCDFQRIPPEDRRANLASNAAACGLDSPRLRSLHCTAPQIYAPPICIPAPRDPAPRPRQWRRHSPGAILNPPASAVVVARQTGVALESSRQNLRGRAWNRKRVKAVASPVGRIRSTSWGTTGPPSPNSSSRSSTSSTSSTG